MTGSQNLLLVPPELLQSILASLPDLQSLVSAALSCRYLYAAFKSRENRLVRSVLTNCIGIANLPEALITHRCSLPTGDVRVHQIREYVSSFIAHLERPGLGSAEMSLAEGLVLSDFHVRTVSPLAQRFAEACSENFAWQRPLNESLQTRPLSLTERERIERTLYHFEIFRRLFGCFGRRINGFQSLAIEFLSKFAPWENDQLYCIHDFLARELLPAFNDVAQHDVVWGAHSVRIMDRPQDLEIQHLLAQGLDRIFEISSSVTYEERAKLLKVREMSPGETEDFLFDALETVGRTDLRLNAKAILEATPFFSDRDGGAEYICRLTCLDPRYGTWIEEWQDLYFRQWCYVLWDHERLQPHLRHLLPPWTHINDSPYDEDQETEVMREWKKTAHESWAARSYLYHRGARGFWSKDDQSRLVWPPHLRRDRVINAIERLIGLLEEARDMWS